MIVTPLDSAQLDSKGQYVFYHQMVDFTMKELIVKMQQQQLCSEKELGFFKQYCDLLLYSIEAMRVKYMYDDEDNMKIDLTDSGFPNYLEFRYLFNDLALREEYLNKLTDIEEIKNEFLDTLMRKKEPIKKSRLFQAASIVYYTNVKQQFIFNRFIQGKILPSAEGYQAQYMTSWSFYDVALNRPFICFLYFDHSAKDPQKHRHQIYEAIRLTADRKMPLDSMAYAIDRKLPELFPRHIKRIDLGPLHNVFAKDENEITHAILDGIGKKVIPLESYAFSMQVDEVVSRSEFKEGSFFSKQTLQRWSEVLNQRYLMAPHRIIQMLYHKCPDLISKLAKPPIQMADLPGAN
jgi:hypothetical protein